MLVFPNFFSCFESSENQRRQKKVRKTFYTDEQLKRIRNLCKIMNVIRGNIFLRKSEIINLCLKPVSALLSGPYINHLYSWPKVFVVIYMNQESSCYNMDQNQSFTFFMLNFSNQTTTTAFQSVSVFPSAWWFLQARLSTSSPPRWWQSSGPLKTLANGAPTSVIAALIWRAVSKPRKPYKQQWFLHERSPQTLFATS